MSRSDIEAILPLSPAQQGMLYESAAAPGSGLHVEQMACRLSGDLDVGAFEAAWRQLLGRHEVLRAGFVWKDQEEPVQVVRRAVEPHLRVEDWRSLDPGEREAALRRFLEEDRREGFRMSRAPLLRLALFRVGESDHELVWTHHHILMDGWCQPLIWNEVLELYRAVVTGQEARLPAPRPYRDFIAWLKRKDLGPAERFWRGMLDGVTRPTLLGRPGGAPAEVPEGERHGELEVSLSADETAALTELARRNQVTLNTLVQGAWALLLGAYGGDDDVVFGITVAGRPAELRRIESTVGLFIATLPIRVRLAPDRPFGPWLRELQERNADLREYEWTPGGSIRQWAPVPAALPLYESVLVFENYPVGDGSGDPGRNGAPLRISDVQSSGGRTGFALTLLALPGSELAFRLVYDRRRIDETGADRFLGGLTRLLRRMPGAEGETLGRVVGDVPAERVPVVADATARSERPATGTETSADPVVEVLAALWAEVLGVEEVSVDDDFFHIGGHSLAAAELVTRVRQALEVDLPLRSLFEGRTVAAMAAEVARRKGRPAGETSLAIPPIVPDPEGRHRPFPLTDVQQAYWIGRTSAVELGNVSTYNYWEVEGTGLDLDRLTAACRRVIARHEMLRAVVAPDGRQRVLPEVPPYEIPVADLRGEDGEAREEALRAVRAEMSAQVLPSDRWPLFDLRASLLPDERVRLHVGFDLLIADGWSLQILGRDLAAFYDDPEAEAPPVELSFRDCVLAEQALRETPVYERAVGYWRERLDTLPPAPDLPLAVQPAALARPRFRRRQATVPAERWRRLKARATGLGLTPSALLLAAFSEVLATWSKSPRFTINLTLFNRLPLHPQVHEVVGDFTSLTLLEVERRPGGGFTEHARRLQSRLWDDLDHRLYSGVQVLRELGRREGGRRRATMPVVFTSTLTLGSAADRAAAPAGLGGPVDSVYSIGQTPQVWLDHQVAEQQGVLILVWDAIDDLFPDGMLDAMVGAYRSLLDRLVEDEGAWRERPRLVPAEQLQVRARLHAADTPVPSGTLDALVLHRVAERGERPAVITGERTLSYRELDQRSGAIAARLLAFGVRPGDRVAVVMEKGWEQVVAVLAVGRAGAAYLPVEAGLPPLRRDLLLARGGCTVALTQERLEGELEWPDGLRVVAVEDREPDPAGQAPTGLRRPEDLAYVIFTSGSTGEPKGVMIDDRGAVNTVLDVNRRWGVGPDDRVLGLSSLSFDLSVWDIFGVLGAGGALVLPEPSAGRDPERWAELIEEHGVTLWNTVPVLLEMLVEGARDRGDGLASLRLALLSGDWIPVGLPDRARELVPGLEVVSLGGATEASIWSIAHPIGRVDPEWASIPYGRPLTHQAFHVLDGGLEDRPEWVPGELFIGGVGVAKGYWRDPRKTAERFVAHPRTGDRLYRTGDLGRYLPGGDLEFLGREDFQVKIRGHRIELGEIESVLERHPSVRAAVVQPVGEGRTDRQLVAYVVPERDAGDPEVAGAVGSPGAGADERARPTMDPSEPLETERFSRVLASLMQVRLPASPLPKYRYPSAGTLYPVQVYVSVRPGAVEGVPGGVHYYHPGHHRLVRSSSEPVAAERFGEADRPAVEAAPFTLFLVGELAAIAPAYGGLAYAFCLLEAGYMAHLLAAVGEEAAVGLRPLPGPADASLGEALGLDPTQVPLHVLVAGAPAGGGADGSTGGPARPRPALPPAEIEIPPLRNAGQILELKLREPGLRPEAAREERVELPRPPRDEAWLAPFRMRRSHREFLASEPPEAAILDLLGSVAGRLATAGVPLEVYVHARPGRVDGLEGLYLFEPSGRRLVPIDAGARVDTEVHGEVNRPAFVASAFSIFFVSGRSAEAAGGRVPLEGDLLEAGALGQVLMTAAPRLRLGLCPIGTLDFDPIRPSFSLPEEAVLLHSFVAGPIGREAALGREADDEATVAPLREHLGDRLPAYMVPATFILLDALPLSANGKVDRSALPSPAATTAQDADFVAPATPLEKRVAALFERFLPAARVGLDDDFFALGGNSLLAVQLVSQVRQDLGRELPLASLFESPTVAHVVQVLEAGGELAWVPTAPRLRRLERREGLPLSFAQQRLWFLAQLEPESPAYNMPSGVHLEGPLRVEAVAAALAEIERRHDVLRTTFSWSATQPVQNVAPPASRPLPLVDLSALAAEDRAAETDRLTDLEAHHPFDLERGPVVRRVLARLGPEEHLLLVTMHHIASDVWSLTIYLREFVTLHARFAAGAPSPLPELAVQYADWASWQRESLEGGALEEGLAFWQRRLAPPIPELALPSDRPRSRSTGTGGDQHPFRLPAELSSALVALGDEEEATLFMVLLSAFNAILYRWTGQTDLVVGTDVAGRTRSETEDMIGFFVNMLALRNDLSGTPTFRELLRRVRSATREAFLHQEVPLDLVVEKVRPARDASHSPLFRVLCVLQNVPSRPVEAAGPKVSVLGRDTRTSKFDLSLFVHETPEGLRGTWVYKTDLFDPETVAGFARQLEVLLRHVTDDPDARLDALEILTEVEKKGRSMEKQKHQQKSIKMFKAVKPKSVVRGGDLVREGSLEPGGTFPVVFEPAGEDVDAVDWVAGNRERLEERLATSGAILLRGFGVASEEEFQKVASAFCPDLYGEYGDLPRGGAEKVYQSTPYPPDKTILFHNESSHMHRWPLRQFFYCVTPAKARGETPIVDCREIYRALRPELLEPFAEKGLLYVRNFVEGLDVGWKEFFRAEERSEVEEYCRDAGIDFEWTEEDGLRTLKAAPAVAVHPRTGEKVFFNQIQLHHVACLDDEVSTSLASIFGDRGMPREVLYGDGSPIPDEVVEEVLDVYWEHSVAFPWQAGDVLIVDNMLVAHARNPFEGPRKMAVAMGAMFEATDL